MTAKFCPKFSWFVVKSGRSTINFKSSAGDMIIMQIVCSEVTLYLVLLSLINISSIKRSTLFIILLRVLFGSLAKLFLFGQNFFGILRN